MRGDVADHRILPDPDAAAKTRVVHERAAIGTQPDSGAVSHRNDIRRDFQIGRGRKGIHSGRSADGVARSDAVSHRALVVQQCPDLRGVIIVEIIPGPAGAEMHVVEQVVVPDDVPRDPRDPSGAQRVRPVTKRRRRVAVVEPL